MPSQFSEWKMQATHFSGTVSLTGQSITHPKPKFHAANSLTAAKISDRLFPT